MPSKSYYDRNDIKMRANDVRTINFFLSHIRELSLPTDAVQRIKATKIRVFILILVNSLEPCCALLQSS